MEILLLIAIAYAGARGLERLAGVDARRASPEAEQVVKDAAGKKSKVPGPTEPGGTFAPVKAAPRTAALGGRAAGPIAVSVETGATMWAALREGYATAWPEARRQARLRMVERAERRRAEREAREAREAESAADQAVRAAEDVLDAAWRDVAAVAGPRPKRVDLTKPATTVEPEMPTGPVEQAEDTEPTATVLPFRPATQGDAMSPNALIPEVRTLDGLLNALQIVNAMCAMRAEEAEVIAADDKTLSNRLDAVEAELAGLEVDPGTRAEIVALRETVHAQSVAAAQYGGAAKDAADLAAAAAQAAHKSHGGIAEAVQSSPIEQAANRGYYAR